MGAGETTWDEQMAQDLMGAQCHVDVLRAGAIKNRANDHMATLGTPTDFSLQTSDKNWTKNAYPHMIRTFCS